MGGISGSREYFISSLIEISGFKTGIVINDQQLFDLLEGFGDLSQRLRSEETIGLRLHSVEIEEAVAYLLFRLGNIRSPNTVNSHIHLFHKYKKNPKKFGKFNEISQLFIDFMNDALKRDHPTGKIDPSDFIQRAFDKHGAEGGSMALEMIEGTNADMHRSPWGSIRSVDWENEVELAELFESESLETMYGDFFDQRYIDFLDHNFGNIGEINWRKFEGLTAEYFTRQGFRVDVGPGRNDDGIDLRVYPEEQSDRDPALIIVQCKRQKAKIDKALIKSVYADVLHEKATSGLIVTTSHLSPGAATMRTARGYPIDDADRETLRSWISNMRTP